MQSDVQQIEHHRPSGLVLTPHARGALYLSSRKWYEEEVTRQGVMVLKKRLGELGAKGEDGAMQVLEMSRSQVQALIGTKGTPTRENLEAALRSIGTELIDVIDERKKRELMIKNAVKHFRIARFDAKEPPSCQQISPCECDRVTRDNGIPPLGSFFDPTEWAGLIGGFQNTYQLSVFDAISVADWAFGRMHSYGFRVRMMTAIDRFGDVDNVDLRERPESPKAKVSVILRLYSAFKGARDRGRVARRLEIKKSERETLIPELIEYSGLQPNDFEPIVSPLPLLLLKSEGTSGYVTDCLKQMAARPRGN